MSVRNLLICALICAFAGSAASEESVRDFVKSLGADKRGNITTRQNVLVNEKIKGVNDTNLKQKNLTPADLGRPGSRPDMVDSAGTEAQSTTNNMPKKPEISDTDYWLRRARGVQSDPQETAGFGKYMSNKYSDCQAQTVANTGIKQSVCDEHITGGKTASCAIGRHVEVDADHTYRCTKDSEKILVNCTQKLQVKCTAGGVLASYLHNNDPDFTIAFPKSFTCPARDGLAYGYVHKTREAEWISLDLGIYGSFVSGFKPKIFQCRYFNSRNLWHIADITFVNYYVFTLTRKTSTQIFAYYNNAKWHRAYRGATNGKPVTVAWQSNAGPRSWDMNWGVNTWAHTEIRKQLCYKWSETKAGESCG